MLGSELFFRIDRLCGRDEHYYNLSSFKMKISRIYLFLCMNFVATVVAYYRRCYDSFSLCLITNTRDDSHNSNSKYRLTWSSAINWCKNHSSSLAIITNETVQSAIEAFIKDPSAKLVDSDVLTNGYRSNLRDWEWIDGSKSAILPRLSYNTSRYVCLVVSSDGRYYLSDGFAYWKKKFICSYVTHNSSCSAGFRQMGSRCYKMYEREVTWFVARNICLKEESDLTTFEDGISSLHSEWFGRYWIGLRKEKWDWFKDQTNYGDIKYSNWEDRYPHSTIGDCLCLNARTAKWANCDCSRTYRYICIQDYVSGSISNVTTTQTTRIITTTTKLKKTTEFGNSTSQFHSTPNRTLDDDFRIKMSDNSTFIPTFESRQTSGFLPFLGIGIACLLIIIVVIAIVVFIKNRRRSTRQEVSYTANAVQPTSSVDDYTTLKRECLSENETYAELNVYETIEDEIYKNSP